jgi:hypothetical protein
MAEHTDLHPPGPEPAVRNRRIIAERLGWPAGAVEVCEQMEQESPGWWATWVSGGGLTWKEPGFSATTGTPTTPVRHRCTAPRGRKAG